jgi:hypothetical protein
MIRLRRCAVIDSGRKALSGIVPTQFLANDAPPSPGYRGREKVVCSEWPGDQSLVTKIIGET